MIRSPEYLGDGVYITQLPYGILLTTGNHEPSLADNKIVLEPEVSAALIKYLNSLNKKE